MPHPSPLTPHPLTSPPTRYTVVGFRGSGPVAFETALGAVFIEGIIFMAIAALGLRGYIVQAIPKPQP
jgi:AGZA family xanthine/uracil permease-like MFS transporter